MKTMVSIGVILAFCSAIPGATHLFWYKAATNGYSLTNCNPGPCLDGSEIIHEGMIATGCVAQHSGSSGEEMVFGSGLDDQQGRCAFIWSYDLCNATGTATSATVRAEYRDGWCGNGCCNAGPINIRCGVVDYQGNLDTWGGAESVPETADWQDFLNPLSSSMGYDFITPTLQAEEVIAWTAPAARPDEFSPSILDGKFFDIDITDQVNYVLQNSGHLAIVLLIAPNEGSTGKVSSYGRESCPDASTLTCSSDNPWTPDGNAAHIVIESDDLAVAVDQKPPVQAVNRVMLGKNLPNPFNPSTRISFNTGKYSIGTFVIYNAMGQAIYSEKVKGKGTIDWNAKGFARGIYLYRLTVGNRVISRQMVYIK